jgi:hypothetical protein
MNIKELRDLLEGAPQDAPVALRGPTGLLFEVTGFSAHDVQKISRPGVPGLYQASMAGGGPEEKVVVIRSLLF